MWINNYNCFYLLLLCCCWLPFNVATQESDYDWFQKGMEQKKAGDYSNAIISFDTYLKHNSTEKPTGYFQRGYTFYYLKKYQSAVQDFQQFSQLDPLNVNGPYALGRTYYQLKAYKEAIQQFTLAVQIDPNHAAAYNDRGMVRCLQKQYVEALEDFYKATTIDSSFAMAYNNTGTARYFNQNIAKPHRKDLEIAHQWFSKAIEKDRTLGLAYRNRAAMNILLQKYDAALIDLNHAAKISPEDAMTYFYYGVVYADQQHTQKAITHFSKALSYNPQLGFAYEELGNLYNNQEHFQKAIEHYQLAKNARQNTSKLYEGLMEYRIALVYAKMKQPTKMYQALKHARKQKVFKDMRVYQDFLSAKEFKNFRKEKTFRRFTRSIRKGEKENKFLRPELAWFRMRK